MHAPTQAPATAGPYVLVEELARGGVAVVHRGLDPERDRVVAVKRLLPAAAASPHLARLFEREYYTLAQLKHPQIIEVFEFGRDADGPFYAMELLDGSDLRELAPLPYLDVCRHGIDVASSLALLHARRVVHRDVSPRNVRLTSDGRAKLIDFGGVASFGVSRDVVGTPPCLAPEILRGLPIDGRTDLFALGAVLYHALTGRYPYPATSLETLESRWLISPPPPSAIVGDIPPALDDLVLSLLRLDPTTRPRTAAEVIDRLAAIADLEVHHDPSTTTSYFHAPPLVGRIPELESLDRAIARSRTGSGRAVLLRGAKGTGRSRLLEVVAHRAAIQGAIVLAASGVGSSAHAVVDQLLHRLLRVQPELRADWRARHDGILATTFPHHFAGDADLDRSRLPSDPGERHARLQEALMALFLEVSAGRFTTILVDDLERCDDESLGLLAALARAADQRSLLVVTAHPSGSTPEARGAYRVLRLASQSIDLGRLSSEDVEALVRSLFADAIHSTRLAAWLHAATGGNPADCIELVRGLVERDLVRFDRGTWTLPARWNATDLPRLEHVRAERFERLSDEAKSVARALCVLRGPLDLTSCLALIDRSTSEAYATFGELVAADVLKSGEHGYVFASEEARDRLYRALSDPERRTLHRRAAAVWRAHPEGPSAERTLEAGYHLLRGGEETEGATLLAEAGFELSQRTRINRAVADAIESALAVYDREGRSALDCYPLLATLMTAGLVVDPVYLFRNGDRALEVATKCTGIALAAKLRPYLGMRLAFGIGIAMAALRLRLQRSGHSLERLFVLLAHTCMTAAGTAAICLDVARLETIERTLRPLGTLPASNVGWFVYRNCRLCLFAISGRHREVEAESEDLRARLERNAFRLPEELRRLALASPLITGGQRYANDGHPRALEIAETLESLRLETFAVNVAYIRQQYYAMRGDAGLAERYRKEIEAIAARGGTTWQAELFAAMNFAELYIAVEDAVGLRACERAVARDRANIPTLAGYEDLIRAAALRAHGANEEAIALYERTLLGGENHPWLLPFADYARALMATGRAAEARRLLESVEEKRIEIGTHGMASVLIPAELALAEAAEGSFEAAEQRLRERLDHEANASNPVRLAILHRTRARVALLAKDAAAYEAHREAMRELVATTTNGALLASIECLDKEAAHSLCSPMAPTDGSELESVHRRFAECASLTERAALALELLVRDALADGGFLFTRPQTEIACLAQSHEGPPPAWLETEVEALFDRLSDETDSETTATVTSIGTSASTLGTSTHMREGYVLAAITTPPSMGTKVPAIVALRRSRQHLRSSLVEAIAIHLLPPTEPKAERVA